MTTTELAPVRRANGDGGEIDLASNFTRDKVELLKRTICRDASDDELELFIHACKRTGLDPFMKQIHAVMRFDKRANRKVMSIQTGVDGYRLIADRTGKYAGNDESVFLYDDAKYPTSATAKVYKLVQGHRYPFEATARWEEYYPGDGEHGFMWRKMPHVMLGKVAETLALRKAFPAELSGVYTREEMEQAGPAAPAGMDPATGEVQEQLASAAQVAEIKRLLALVRLPEGTVDKWFAKQGVDLWEDFPADVIAKCIQYVKGRLPREPETAPTERPGVEAPDANQSPSAPAPEPSQAEPATTTGLEPKLWQEFVANAWELAREHGSSQKDFDNALKKSLVKAGKVGSETETTPEWRREQTDAIRGQRGHWAYLAK